MPKETHINVEDIDTIVASGAGDRVVYQGRSFLLLEEGGRTATYIAEDRSELLVIWS